jgi:hypothetical protein
MLGDHKLAWSPFFSLMGFVTRVLSPYEFNPSDYRIRLPPKIEPTITRTVNVRFARHERSFHSHAFCDSRMSADAHLGEGRSVQRCLVGFL